MDDSERAERQAIREAWALGTLARHQAVLDDLCSRAAEPRDWLGVARHADRLEAILASWPPARLGATVGTALAEVKADLDQARRGAEVALSEVVPEERESAAAALGLRIAVIGKGGAGKTVLSSTLSRLLARDGRQVLLVDLDTCPGSSYSVGLGGSDCPLPDEALEQNPGASYGWQLSSGLLPRQAVKRFSAPAPDGVRFLSLGKIGDTDKLATKKTVTATVQTLVGFAESDWDVVADLEAGPTTPFERYHSFADIVLVVVGPSWRSALTARRLLPMVDPSQRAVIVANRFRDEPDHPGLVPEVRIPFDADVAEAERQGLAPLDACEHSATVAAIGRLARQLLVRDPVAIG